MSTPSVHSITHLLAHVADGNEAARSELWKQVYDELHSLARYHMAHEARDRTLQATSLVHEAFLRLIRGKDGFENRRHFFGAAARAMRQIRIDDARRRNRLKRLGRRSPVATLETPRDEAHHDAEILALSDVLERLEQIDPRKAEIVTWRYFVGLTEEETAAALGLSRRTVQLEWRFAKAWLHRELSKGSTTVTKRG